MGRWSEHSFGCNCCGRRNFLKVASGAAVVGISSRIVFFGEQARARTRLRRSCQDEDSAESGRNWIATFPQCRDLQGLRNLHSHNCARNSQ
jgi:hypothetical protein